MNAQLIRELRNLTSAGMSDCKSALEEAAGDLEKAIDIIKVKGKNIADGRSGRQGTEGRVVLAGDRELSVLVEVNSNTDFTANNSSFVQFAETTAQTFHQSILNGVSFQPSDVEPARQEVVSQIKENIVVRRWWAEQSQSPVVRVFSYLHSNHKIGVLLTLQAPSVEAANSQEFQELGENLAMQVAAMSPLAVSGERIGIEEKNRQEAIFTEQMKAENKPEKMWGKIMEGKFGKWYKEVCLLDQESVMVPKTAVKKVIEQVGKQLEGEIVVVNFVRAEVREGIEKEMQEDYAAEIAKMTGVEIEQ
jgi:elongation factor Ts